MHQHNHQDQAVDVGQIVTQLKSLQHDVEQIAEATQTIMTSFQRQFENLQESTLAMTFSFSTLIESLEHCSVFVQNGNFIAGDSSTSTNLTSFEQVIRNDSVY